MAVASKPPMGASRNGLEAWFAAAVAADANLRQELLHNTQTTLEHLFGRKKPDDIKIVAVEEVATDLYIVRRFEGATEPVEADGTDAQLETSNYLAVWAGL
jgi:hypothetical protein